ARALGRGAVRPAGWWLLVTVALGAIFLSSTAREWYGLIYVHHLTIATNLFGTTFYPLVGLHASHVVAGVIMLGLCTIFAFSGARRPAPGERVEMVSWYWHFVDAVWVVVFTVVYVIGRCPRPTASPAGASPRASSCPRRRRGRWRWPSASR